MLRSLPRLVEQLRAESERKEAHILRLQQQLEQQSDQDLARRLKAQLTRLEAQVPQSLAKSLFVTTA